MLPTVTAEQEFIAAADALSYLLESGEATPDEVLESFEDAEIDLALRENWVTIDGRHIDIGADNAGERLSKSEIAKSAYNGGGVKGHQDIAEASEHELSKGLGLAKSDDNRPFDLFQGKTGIEIKTFLTNGNDKITMSKDAIGRKVAFIKANKLTRTYTIVADKRGDLASSPKYYIRDGYGSFRLGTMTEMSMAGMKTYIAKRGTGKFSL